jgi:hypothetical protein
MFTRNISIVYWWIITVAPRCLSSKCYNGGTCYEHSPASTIFAYCLCKWVSCKSCSCSQHRNFIDLGLASQVLDVKQVNNNRLQSNCSLFRHVHLEYFRCPTNGFYADAYGCAQGKYFECVEQSSFVFYGCHVSVIDGCCFRLFRSYHYFSFMSTRPTIQFLPWSLRLHW